MILKRDFYLEQDVCKVAQNLLGKVLISKSSNGITAGIITETEAYCGVSDRASHAYPLKRTPRTNIFYGPGGFAYVYLCYGIHNLFNVITSLEDDPKAVLVRAITPLEGLELMRRRRKTDNNVANGPGKLTQALGITLKDQGQKLFVKKRLWIEDHGITLDFQRKKRIGIDYAGKDADLLWRFISNEI